MPQAALYGALAASSVVVGAVIALVFKPRRQIIGAALAFGAGALISAVAYDLVLDAVATGTSFSILAVSLGAGAITFFLGDLAIDRRSGDHRRRMARSDDEGSALALFLGLLLDGIPESFIIGSALVTEGEVGVAFLAAVFVSNVPEAMATSSGFRSAGMSTTKIYGLWCSVVAVSAIAAAVGFAVFDRASGLSGVVAQGFAAGSVLTMLTDTMLPEALEEAGKVAGLFTVLGFATAVALSGAA